MEAKPVLVYRGMDQAALDQQYDNRAAAPDAGLFLARRASASEKVRRTFACRLDVPYGPSPDQLLDIFPAGTSSGPVEIYIHGGLWRGRSKDDASFLAETLVPAGIALVAINHSLAPRATLDEIVSQTRAAVVWAYQNAPSFGADPGRLHISGHSSGAHLAAMALATRWGSDFGLPDDLIKSACLTSGLYDLEPIRLSSANELLRLDQEAAHRNSPIHHLPAVAGPLIISVAGRDTREFQRQTREYRDAWQRAGHPCRFVEMPGEHHYSMSLEMGNPDSPLFRALLAEIVRRGGLPR